MANPDEALPYGSYEAPVTRRLSERMKTSRAVDPLVQFATVEGASPQTRDRFASAVTHEFAERFSYRLRSLTDDADRLDLINRIARLLDDDNQIDAEHLLYSVYRPPLIEPPRLPEIPLTAASLLTNTHGEANFSHELRRELATADSVDLLCAFIKNSGISVLHDELMGLKERGIPLRVITSTYCGATDAEAVRRLASVYGAEIRVGYESTSTRLHAKAWLFRRNSGFDSAFIGSSNLSNAALVSGVEWNVRTSSTMTPSIISKFIATFDTYWNSTTFRGFDPVDDVERLKEALHNASWPGENHVLELSSLDVRPHPHQEVMLEALRAERDVHDRHKNLIVAATGTGKTVVAALDYRNLTHDNGGTPPRLLFVAHRKEILEQSLRTYREVLRRPDFGELLVDGHTPTRWQHVFASIQSLNTERLTSLTPDHFEVVVVDEFHHAHARSYRRVLDHVEPRELLGLTATPERSDGVDVAEFFDFRVAHELRLWDALQDQLLAPMHYYGINDDTDLSGVTWTRGDYDRVELGELYLRAGDRRVRLILSEIDKKIFDPGSMKALGFCVSVRHAEFMAERFNAHGVPSTVVTGTTPKTERARAIADLRSGAVKVIFSVDVFNEGVDIPETNTILLLRPTQSATTFLQQLGRGLRLCHGKDVCTVLDFVGQQHQEFDFTERYAALTKRRGKRLYTAIEEDFPKLPPGTSIQLDRQVRERVLENARRAASSNLRKLRFLVSRERATDLSRFLAATGLNLEDIYRPKDSSWTTLLRYAKLLPTPDPVSPVEAFLLKGIRKFIHVNDPERAEAYVRLSADGQDDYSQLSERDKTYARMLCLVFWAGVRKDVPVSYEQALRTIRSVPSIHRELKQVFAFTTGSSQRITEPIKGGAAETVLLSHADYSRAELVAALEDQPLPQATNLFREGVHYYESRNLDLFLVTLDKDDDSFSPTTSYKDYPLDTDLFHWESQSGTSLGSPTGQRYIHHQNLGTDILLAVRITRNNSLGLAAPFALLGTVEYKSHRGEKPIQFEWKLHRPMPPEIYKEGRAVS